MKAMVLNGTGQQLTVEEVSQPTPGADEAIVRIHAAGLNKRDWWIQQGKYAGLKFPIILGSDGSGTVFSVGEDLPASWIGQDVVIYPAQNWGDKQAFQSADFKILGLPDNGCMATYVRVKGYQLFPKPDHLDYQQSAAIPIAGLTAFRALFVKGEWQAGDRVLISGVGGGTGAFALQWALAAGAAVWVTSGSREKIDRAISMGAKGGYLYKEAGWAQKCKSEAGTFDVIIDSALGEGFADLVSLCSPGARVIFFGGTAGNMPSLNGRPIFWHQIQVKGTTLGSPADFEHMLSFIKEHQIIPVIDKIFPMESAQQAIDSMDTGSDKFGKTILKID